MGDEGEAGQGFVPGPLMVQRESTVSNCFRSPCVWSPAVCAGNR